MRNMWKRKKYLIPATLLAIIILFHFVPIYSNSAWLNGSAKDPGKISSNLCNGYLFTTVTPANSEPDNYRVLPNGIGNFLQDKKNLHKTSIDCWRPVTLRLYLW
jgi:hypothetical protein